jgi:crotonobetainyl-CoA:carnitine CoA-transferase CaiB-like acyl-CoA transferase
MPERDFSWPVYDIFDTADDKQIFLAVVTNGQWQVACRMFGLTDLLDDPTLEGQMDRINARSRTVPRFAAVIGEHTLAELEAMFDEANLPFSPINRPQDMYHDPHVLRPGGLVASTNADGRPFRTPALPIELDGHGLAARADVPRLGADTDAVLGELGYSAAEIEAVSGRARAAAE